jgi:hypothetical protein
VIRGSTSPTRDLVTSLLALAGAALLCVAVLDWIDYAGFVTSLRWR